MRFRPCIDIHNGAVKQIVGGSLKDQGDQVIENFRSDQDAAYYARMYREDDLPGGHVILLNSSSSPYYEKTKEHFGHIRKGCRSEVELRRRMQKSIWRPEQVMSLLHPMYLRTGKSV